MNLEDLGRFQKIRASEPERLRERIYGLDYAVEISAESNQNGIRIFRYRMREDEKPERSLRGYFSAKTLYLVSIPPQGDENGKRGLFSSLKKAMYGIKGNWN